METIYLVQLRFDVTGDEYPALWLGAAKTLEAAQRIAQEHLNDPNGFFEAIGEESQHSVLEFDDEGEEGERRPFALPTLEWDGGDEHTAEVGETDYCYTIQPLTLAD